MHSFYISVVQTCIVVCYSMVDGEHGLGLIMYFMVCVAQNMWFTPVRDRPHLDEESLLRKVNNITEVVVACKDTGLDWFEQLLHSVSCFFVRLQTYTFLLVLM